MSQHIEGPRKTFTAGTALNPNLRVKITSADGAYGPTVGLAGATDPCIGVVEEYAASGGPVTIYLANAQGTRKMSATAVAITANNPVYAAANGQVASTGTVVEGKALESTGGSSGDLLEVLPVANSDISTAIAGTTNATFEVDTDSAAPKIGFAPNTGGTGDFTTWLTTEATLSADNTITVPESNGDTLMACTLAQTVPGIKTFSGGIIMSGAVDLAFTGTTGQSEVVVQTNLADALSVKDAAGDLIVVDTTTGTQVITITPALTVTGLITSNGGLTLSGAVDLTFSGTTGQPEIMLTANLADALSIKDSTGDLLVFTTTTGALAINSAARFSATGNTANTAGVGITGTATSWVTSVTKEGSLIKTTLVVDLEELYAGGTAGDIIGANGAGVAHLGRITAAVNGTIIAGRMVCLEAPAGGDTDIDLYSATEATGVEDEAIGGLTSTQLVDSGVLSAGTAVVLAAPAADQYLYLVGQAGGNAKYTAGKLLIEFWGK